MNTIFYLPNCSTCTKALAQIMPDNRLALQNLKQTPISAEQLDELAKRVGSYSELFNKQSRQYREKGLNNLSLSEADYRQWILNEYTFLKRPIVLFNNQVFICRSADVIEQLKYHLGQ
jgi:arsenate reductase (glutaredoxin)